MKSAPTFIPATLSALSLLGCLFVHAPSAHAELWRSALHDLTYVQVEKRILAETYDPQDDSVPPTAAEVEPLPVEIIASLGR